MVNYENKYLKYKNKYFKLLKGGNPLGQAAKLLDLKII